MRVIPLVIGAAASALLVTGCSGAASDLAATASTDSTSSSTASPAPEPQPESTMDSTPEDAGGAAVDQVKPQAKGMAVDAFADAVLDQLKFSGPGTLSDQLVTIAMSPLTRQMASSADISTRLDSKGAKVIFTLAGGDVTCKITVTDAPAARGVNCVA